MTDNYKKFIEAINFNGDYGLSYADKPCSEFIKENQAQFISDMDKAIAGGNEKVEGNCLNLALYFRDKVQGLLMVCDIEQGHSNVLHLDKGNNVVVTAPLISRLASIEKDDELLHYQVPVKEFFLTYPSFNNAATYTAEQLENEEITMRSVLKRDHEQNHLKTRFMFGGIKDEQKLNEQLEEIKEVLLSQKVTKKQEPKIPVKKI